MINIPPLTEERRLGLVKSARNEGEEAKISIRAARKDANDEIKKLDGLPEDVSKGAEKSVQEVTDDYVKQVDRIVEKKEADIMVV